MLHCENFCDLDAIGSLLKTFLAQSVSTNLSLTCSSLHAWFCTFWFVTCSHGHSLWWNGGSFQLFEFQIQVKSLGLSCCSFVLGLVIQSCEISWLGECWLLQCQFVYVVSNKGMAISVDVTRVRKSALLTCFYILQLVHHQVLCSSYKARLSPEKQESGFVRLKLRNVIVDKNVMAGISDRLSVTHRYHNLSSTLPW